MQIIHYPADGISLPETAIALGFFDGAHIGHRHLIARMMSEAKARGLATAIFTFPSESLGLKSGVFRLYETKEKIDILASFNPDYIIIADFSALSSASPEDFVTEHLCRRLNCRLAVAGYNFRFGSRASGRADDLVRLMTENGGDSLILPEERMDGMTLSTTAIRAALAEGDCETATAMLGEPYFVNATVVRGMGIGKAFGFPTLNTEKNSLTPLPRGVYATVVTLGEKKYIGVTNLGVCPTFTPREEHLETMLLDFSGTVYGETVKIAFIGRLRDESVFPSPEALKKQIDLDAKKARDLAKRYI